MRKIAGPGHVSNEFKDYDAISNPTGTVHTADWGNDVQRELIGIQDEFSIAEADGSNKYILAAIKGLAIRFGKQLGELFFLDQHKTPAAFDKDNPENFFPGLCLDTISSYMDISSTNWSDLVTHLRAKVFKYMEGTGSEKFAFDVTNWAIVSNVATLTLANTTAENAILAALAEENLVHGGYSNWRSITLPSAIGDITAGEYAITDVDAAARTIDFAFTAADNSGSGTWTVNFYQHRIPGSTTTARVYEVTARSLVSANDGDGEAIAGMRRRDRFQGFTFNVTAHGDLGLDSLSISGGASGMARWGTNTSSVSISTDGVNGTPRTGKTTDPRALIGHLYIWAKSYVA